MNTSCVASVIPSRADGEGPHIETLRFPQWKAFDHSTAWEIFPWQEEVIGEVPRRLRGSG
jgi:hypothetical protein